MKKIMDWCKIPHTNFNSVRDIVNFAGEWGTCPRKRKIMVAIVFGFIWSIWRARNGKIFKKLCVPSNKVVEDVITLAFSWVRYRGNWEFLLGLIGSVNCFKTL